MLFHDKLFMYIKDDYFYFEPISLVSKIDECMCIDRKLNEAYLFRKSSIPYLTNYDTITKTIYGIVGSIQLISGKNLFWVGKIFFIICKIKFFQPV